MLLIRSQIQNEINYDLLLLIIHQALKVASRVIKTSDCSYDNNVSCIFVLHIVSFAIQTQNHHIEIGGQDSFLKKNFMERNKYIHIIIQHYHLHNIYRFVSFGITKKILPVSHNQIQLLNQLKQVHISMQIILIKRKKIKKKTRTNNQLKIFWNTCNITKHFKN